MLPENARHIKFQPHSGRHPGVIVASLYRLAVQPLVHTNLELVFTIAPFILIGGLARASVRFGAPAIDANMCFMLASQAALPAVTGRIAVINGAGALLLAATLVTLGFAVLPRRDSRYEENAWNTFRSRALGALRSVQGYNDELKTNLTGDVLRLAYRTGTQRGGQSPLGLLNLIDFARLVRSSGSKDKQSEDIAVEAVALMGQWDAQPNRASERLRWLATKALDPVLEARLRASATVLETL